MKSRISSIIFATALLILPITNAFAVSYPKTTENGREFYLYKVQKSEGFYSIGKKFMVSREVIVQYNPETAEGIKLGQVLKIPVTEDNKSLSSFEEMTVVPEYKVEDSGIVHKVRSKETLYSISNRYEVSVDDILELNPQAVKLNVGMELRIPKKVELKNDNTTITSRTAQQSENVAVQTAPASSTQVASSAAGTQVSGITSDNLDNYSTQEDSNSAYDADWYANASAKRKGLNDLRIAVLLPFSLDSVVRDNNMNHFVDFYRGCLIAADSLKNLGMNITVDAYDIGNSSIQLGNVLADPQLRKADMIFGPAYTNQIYHVARFAKSNDIPLIVPFTNNIKDVADNSCVYQVLCPQKQLYEKVTDHYATEWAGKTVLIVQPDSLGITYNKRDFTDLLIPKLQVTGSYCSYIPEKELLTYVDSIAQIQFNDIYGPVTRDVVLIVPTNNRPKLMELSEHIATIQSRNVSLFAFPEWDSYQLKELYQKPVYIFNSYKPNPINSETARFYTAYYKKFGNPQKQSKPSFALMGYDLVLYFGQQWKLVGKGMEYGLAPETKTQLSFDFERQGRNSGFINKGVFYNIYTRDGIEQTN